MFLFFFFSSRRRHTRWPRDWSSDVCSSDLSMVLRGFIKVIIHGFSPCHGLERLCQKHHSRIPPAKIGRASCRERVSISVGAGSVKKKKEHTRRHTRGNDTVAMTKGTQDESQ